MGYALVGRDGAAVDGGLSSIDTGNRDARYRVDSCHSATAALERLLWGGKLTISSQFAMQQLRAAEGQDVAGSEASENLGDTDTLKFYENSARSYVGARPQVLSLDLVAFLPRLPAGATILELGCGSGADAVEMERLGFKVEATDGSANMAAIASETLGRHVQVLRFGDLDASERYDAVVACASLLHVPIDGLPEVLHRIWNALKPGGWHFASFKTEGRASRDEHGRYYNYLDRDTAKQAYEVAGDWQSISFETYDGVGYFSAASRWLTVSAQKVS